MNSLPADLLDILRCAGWGPGRNADIGDLVDLLHSCGFVLSAPALDFLREFGFLRLEHEPSIILRGKKSPCWTTFDPTAVATHRDARIADRCSSVVGKSLCPVGVDGFHFTIYMTNEGSLLAGRDASVFRYAESVQGLLRAMFDGSRPTKIADWVID
ncbi:SUKH-3 domain-containing protein [Solwaraspora sp. WMMB762]|uniref:SUKH-3 domain-containing protein n=1 Tax=Solwaraspora sp. WMMB762 TaxID=3404120 RepID=UPI003B95CEE2